MASAYHIPVSPHGNPQMAVHLVASLSNAIIMETMPGKDKQQHYNIAFEPLVLKDGHVLCPDRPGLGVDPDVVKKYRVG